MSAAFVLEAEGLRKSFGGLQAVQGMSFTVAPAELVALIGPNGAGKSTCFNMLMGQLAADAGTVRILGEDVTGWPPRRIWRKGVGRTFQITQIMPSFTVRENVQLALVSHSTPAVQRPRPGAPRPCRRRRCAARAGRHRRLRRARLRRSWPMATSSGWSSPSRSPTSPGCS